MVGSPLAVLAGEIEPQEPGVPPLLNEHDNDQVTPLLDESLTTVAVNGAAAPATRLVEGGDVTETWIPSTWSIPELEMEEFAVQVAVKVTDKPAGAVLDGAV